VKLCRGTLAVAQATLRAGLNALVLASDGALEASLVEGLEVAAVARLSSAIRVLSGVKGAKTRFPHAAAR
jgi:hypothetical protein